MTNTLEYVQFNIIFLFFFFLFNKYLKAKATVASLLSKHLQYTANLHELAASKCLMYLNENYYMC